MRAAVTGITFGAIILVILVVMLVIRFNPCKRMARRHHARNPPNPPNQYQHNADGAVPKPHIMHAPLTLAAAIPVPRPRPVARGQSRHSTH